MDGKVRLLNHAFEAFSSTPSNGEIPDGVKMIFAPKIWETSNRGDGIVIAVIDTGCDVDHPDLKDRIIGGCNFTTDYDGDRENFRDNHYHGTHVCGTIAANGEILGVAPEAKLLVLKALDSNGEGDAWSVAQAVDYARTWVGPLGEKVRVITMSLGSKEDIPILHATIIHAVSEGIVVNCAGGNFGDGLSDTDEVAYPGAYPECVCVAACDAYASVARFSDTNDEVDIMAPGVEVLSTLPGNHYGKLSGTSMAAPHVAGALALIIAETERDYSRRLLEAEIYAQLCRRAEALTNVTRREQGNGLLQLTRGYTPLDRQRSLEEIDRVEAITGLLQETAISDSPDYWLENAQEGKECNGAYVELAFKKMYKGLILRS